MALDLSGFSSEVPQFEGLYRAGDTLERRRVRDQQLAQQQEGRKLATTKFLSDYLDPKDRLTGTNYDPEIVNQLQTALQEGAQLASKGASTADIMLALGPKVNKINEYSTKAKLVNQQIKSSLDKLKGYGGYNLAAMEDEAKKMAFQDDSGKLKDISLVDPQLDYITEVTQKRPELVTTGAGLDQFVTKTPVATYSRTAQTSYGGRTKNVKYETTHPFWEDLAVSEKGDIATDAAGNPIGLDVVGTTMVGDDGKPMINPETKEPYKVMDKGHFTAIMQHNPDVADFVRGQVNRHFKEAGAEAIPAEGSPQWEMMARSILRDELKTRSRSSFKTIEQEKQTAPSVKIDIARDPSLLQSTRDYYSATRRQPGEGADRVNRTTTYADVLTNVFNNEPDYSGGEVKDVKGRKVVDITSYVPDLKYSNDQVYKSVYRDPDKNSLIVEKQNGEIEEVPQSKIFQFMNKLSGYNNLNPDYIRKTMEQSGFQGGQFGKAKPGQAQQQIQEATQKEQQQKQTKLQSFQSSGNATELKDFSGTKTGDGTIKKIAKTSAFNLVNDYYIEFEDGTEKKFKDKKELSDYLKEQQPESASSSDWRSRAKKVQ